MFRDTKKRTKFDHISIKTIACVKGFSTECNSWFEYISFEWHCFAFSSLLFHFIFSLLLLHCFQYDEPFSFFCLILIYALFFSFILWFNAHITFICAAANFFLLNSFLDIQKSVIFIVYSFIHFDLKIHLHWRENMLDLIRRLLKLEYSLKYYMFFFWHVYFCFNIRY